MRSTCTCGRSYDASQLVACPACDLDAADIIADRDRREPCAVCDEAGYHNRLCPAARIGERRYRVDYQIGGRRQSLTVEADDADMAFSDVRRWLASRFPSASVVGSPAEVA